MVADSAARNFVPDFSTLFENVRTFLRSLQIEDGCKIDKFLNLRKPSKASKLLELSDISEKMSAGKALAKLKETGKGITCNDCKKIGDIVIALKQQAAWSLVHIDSAFDILCQATGRDHKKG